MKKFEIKGHDGPGRYGKLDDEETPIIIDKNKFTVIEDESVSYDIEREIAIWSVNQTIAKAKDIKESGVENKIATIQGSKYIDLRIKCVKELEEMGYDKFIIANGDDLILHPRDLVELIVNLRKNMKPGSILIFPFGESQLIPLLAYLGLDGFFDDVGEYYAYLNVLMTPTKNYNLNKYHIYEMNTKELTDYNKSTIDLVLREVREHMKNGGLRNLVEERSATSPQYSSALRVLDKDYADYVLEYSQLY